MAGEGDGASPLGDDGANGSTVGRREEAGGHRIVGQEAEQLRRHAQQGTMGKARVGVECLWVGGANDETHESNRLRAPGDVDTGTQAYADNVRHQARLDRRNDHRRHTLLVEHPVR